MVRPIKHNGPQWFQFMVWELPNHPHNHNKVGQFTVRTMNCDPELFFQFRICYNLENPKGQSNWHGSSQLGPFRSEFGKAPG